MSVAISHVRRNFTLGLSRYLADLAVLEAWVGGAVSVVHVSEIVEVVRYQQKRQRQCDNEKISLSWIAGLRRTKKAAAQMHSLLGRGGGESRDAYSNVRM